MAPSLHQFLLILNFHQPGLVKYLDEFGEQMCPLLFRHYSVLISHNTIKRTTSRAVLNITANKSFKTAFYGSP